MTRAFDIHYAVYVNDQELAERREIEVHVDGKPYRLQLPRRATFGASLRIEGEGGHGGDLYFEPTSGPRVSVRDRPSGPSTTRRSST